MFTRENGDASLHSGYLYKTVQPYVLPKVIFTILILTTMLILQYGLVYIKIVSKIKTTLYLCRPSIVRGDIAVDFASCPSGRLSPVWLKFFCMVISHWLFIGFFCKKICITGSLSNYIHVIAFFITLDTVSPPFAVQFKIFNSPILLYFEVYGHLLIIVISLFITVCLFTVSITVGRPTRGTSCIIYYKDPVNTTKLVLDW